MNSTNAGVDFLGRCVNCGVRVETSGGCMNCRQRGATLFSTAGLVTVSGGGLPGIQVVDAESAVAALHAMLRGQPPLYNWADQNHRAGWDQAVHEVARRLGLTLPPHGAQLPGRPVTNAAGFRIVSPDSGFELA